MFQLPKPKVSGGFQVSDTVPFTVLARIAPESSGPASLTVLNTHATAVLYLKWIPWDQTGQKFETADAGIVLIPSAAYTWDNPPQGAMLLARSSVNGAVAAVDGHWYTPQEAQLQ